MSINTYRKYAYSVPFFIMGIGFLGLLQLHWFAGAIAAACFFIGLHNFAGIHEHPRDEVRS